MKTGVKSKILQKVTVHCPAKLNLTFDLLGKREDGYHEIETILQSIDLEDRITFEFEPSEKSIITIQCQEASYAANFPTDDSNLIVRAAHLFLRSTNVQPSIKIAVCVEKRIPIGAGLAGGSSNGAGTLVGLNHAFGQPLEQRQIFDLASKLGADVPFCLEGGTKIGRGKGDILTDVEGPSKMVFLLIKPRNLSTSTTEIYSAFDKLAPETDVVIHPDFNQSVIAVATGDLLLASRSFQNVFETVVFKTFPELRTLKERIIELGAFSCNMTGSGPTLFALVADHMMAHHIGRHMLAIMETSPQLLENIYPIDYWIVESIQRGASIQKDRKE